MQTVYPEQIQKQIDDLNYQIAEHDHNQLKLWMGNFKSIEPSFKEKMEFERKLMENPYRKVLISRLVEIVSISIPTHLVASNGQI